MFEVLTRRVLASALSLLLISTAALTAAPQGQSLKAERAKFLTERYLQDARELRSSGRNEEALSLLLRAKELSPANQDVLSALAEVQSALQPGHPGTGQSFAEQMQRLWQIREQRARQDALQRMEAAERSITNEDYEAAIADLDAVLLRIDVAPDIDWQDIGDRANEMRARAQELHDRHAAEKQAAIEDEIYREQRLAEEARAARLTARVDNLLDKAVRAFDGGHYELARDLAFDAMTLDQTNHLAREIHDTATKAQRTESTERYRRSKREQFKRMLEQDQDLRVPQSDILRVDRATWKRASMRDQGVVPADATDPDDRAVRELVRSKQVPKVQFTEETGDYGDVIRLLRSMTNVPIMMSQEARDAVDGEGLVMEIDIAAPISLANFLDLMVDKSETLAWTVRNGVVEITTKAKSGGADIMISHDVRDLVFPRTTFLPPIIRDIPSGDIGLSGPRIGSEGDEKVAYIEADVLKTNIESATGGDTYWEADGGGRMDYVESGYLLCHASPEMQERVRRFIEDQRRFATSVVTIETKFLTITQNYLQEIGVDFRGLGGSGNKGTEATLDDVTNALDDSASRGLDNQGSGDAASNPSAGAFFNDGGDGDVRARTENFFGAPLGQALTANGGFTAAFSLLDDLELQALIQAIEKQEDIQVVNSQMLTVLNNERANMAVINQTSYIRDFDVEVAQASFIADPKVDVIQDGIVLDVRPTIAHDRKNIMLSLQPTVAELTRPIPTFTTSLAGTTLPVILQLPTMTVRSFATSASVPDGGSVLIGGLREVLSRERRAEVPLLSKIPLISFLFKQEGVSDENTSLSVLVTATITELTEVADQLSR